MMIMAQAGEERDASRRLGVTIDAASGSIYFDA